MISSKSLSEQLAEITNPVPTIHDPEDDIYEETRAQVLDRDAELPADEEVVPSRLRQRAAALLPDTDPRYAGRTVSRRSLLSASDGEDSAAGSSDGGGDSDAPGDEEDNDDEDNEDEDQLEAFKARLNGAGTDTGGLSPDDAVETDSEEAAESQPGPASEGGTDEEAGSEDEEAGSEGEDAAGSSASEDEDDAGGATRDEDEEEDGVNLTGDSAGSDSRKGSAVRAQLGIWDQLLECRIKLQPCVQLCNQLPAPADWQPFWAAADEATVAKLSETAAAAGRLLRHLVQLQELLLVQYPETRRLASDPVGRVSDAAGDSASEGEPAPRLALYRPYRDETIQRWNDKTRLTAGRAAAKSFAAFEQSTLKQIEQILSDRERLLRRTRLRRTEGATLGRPPPPPQEASTAADGKRDYDDEVFDDNDFYHQLLRELIERKTVDVSDPLALGRQWIQIQKLRSKIKKRVDTRASKGRKVRYEVYPKLVNFLASQRAGSMSAAARDELFSSLFGSRCRPEANGRTAAAPSLNG
ncbi:protein AATF-like, partial [Pollicipes pollicipes]|uniref:protein AATF-like n=1 Tax=Pollicipes pollicipes TaxID=41117 RepID=UPI001884AF11